MARIVGRGARAGAGVLNACWENLSANGVLSVCCCWVIVVVLLGIEGDPEKFFGNNNFGSMLSSPSPFPLPLPFSFPFPFPCLVPPGFLPVVRRLTSLKTDAGFLPVVIGACFPSFPPPPKVRVIWAVLGKTPDEAPKEEEVLDFDERRPTRPGVLVER